MARPAELSPAEVADLLARFPRWAQHGEALAASFEFADFSAAFGFMARVALVAERLDHHPDWSNSYGRVDISITTHSVGTLTALDAAFVEAIEWVRASNTA